MKNIKKLALMLLLAAPWSMVVAMNPPVKHFYELTDSRFTYKRDGKLIWDYYNPLRELMFLEFIITPVAKKIVQRQFAPSKDAVLQAMKENDFESFRYLLDKDSHAIANLKNTNSSWYGDDFWQFRQTRQCWRLVALLCNEKECEHDNIPPQKWSVRKEALGECAQSEHRDQYAQTLVWLADKQSKGGSEACERLSEAYAMSTSSHISRMVAPRFKQIMVQKVLDQGLVGCDDAESSRSLIGTVEHDIIDFLIPNDQQEKEKATLRAMLPIAQWRGDKRMFAAITSILHPNDKNTRIAQFQSSRRVDRFWSYDAARIRKLSRLKI